MPKAVMLSIKPKYCVLIANGKKTIEIRKSRPKIKPPFKCYIYCSKEGNDRNPNKNAWMPDSTGFIWLLNGKVIGEFVCDKIYDCDADSVGLFDKATKAYISGSCLGFSEICTYAKGVLPLYGWHISDLVIYDKPKDLSEFYRWWDGVTDIRPCQNGKKCKHTVYDYSEDCEACAIDFDGTDCPFLKVVRPPQSWCYVEKQA